MNHSDPNAPIQVPPADDRYDLIVVGAGAAGLMAGITAGRSDTSRRILLLDGAPRLGAKILVSGGGRCNVTHDVVDATAFAGSSRNAINKVLRQFPVAETIRFFRELGVGLKREDTGKLFPTSDSARSVLDVLIGGARDAGCRILHPWRVETIEHLNGDFLVSGLGGRLAASRLILATGGKSLPRSGSDGYGLTLASRLGHHITPTVFPALVPLLLPASHFLTELSGLSVRATVGVRFSSGKKGDSFTDSVLCTHFGVSGPAILDVSRYWTAARLRDPGTRLVIDWLPDIPANEIEQELSRTGRSSFVSLLHRFLPERLARGLLAHAGVPPGSLVDLTRNLRRGLVSTLKEMDLPVTGDRGYKHAEVTAGGIPLSEIHIDRMESRVCPGLFLCGEICDVDGRIGGYNFQWAWASGYVAGKSVWN